MKPLRDTIREFNTERDWEKFHSPKNLAMALMVETAELAEHFQWLTQEQSRVLPPEKKEKVGEEIGDILIYLVTLADTLGIDPMQSAISKIEANRQKYPVQKFRGSSLKYNEFK